MRELDRITKLKCEWDRMQTNNGWSRKDKFDQS